MNNSISVFLALLFYGIATLWQSIYFKHKTIVTAQRFPAARNSSPPCGRRLGGRVRIPGNGPLIIGFVAVLFHTVLLYHWIDVGIGQNLSIFNLLSLVAWLVALLILLAAFTKPVANLTLIIFPLAVFSIILALLFPQFIIVNTAANPKQLIHILLSTLAFSTLCIAGVQAIMLAMQERLLHHKQTMGGFQILPPLEIMESLLFEMIGVGFILLTVVVLTSFWAFYPIFYTVFWQKSLLALVAWLVFAVLLIGRLFFGWRGQQVVRWTLSGVFFVMLTYFSSQFL